MYTGQSDDKLLSAEREKLYTVVWQTPAEDYVTVIGNFGDAEQSISIGFGKSSSIQW